MVKIFNGPGETAPARNGVFPPPLRVRARGRSNPTRPGGDESGHRFVTTFRGGGGGSKTLGIFSKNRRCLFFFYVAIGKILIRTYDRTVCTLASTYSSSSNRSIRRGRSDSIILPLDTSKGIRRRSSIYKEAQHHHIPSHPHVSIGAIGSNPRARLCPSAFLQDSRPFDGGAPHISSHPTEHSDSGRVPSVLRYLHPPDWHAAAAHRRREGAAPAPAPASAPAAVLLRRCSLHPGPARGQADRRRRPPVGTSPRPAASAAAEARPPSPPPNDGPRPLPPEGGAPTPAARPLPRSPRPRPRRRRPRPLLPRDARPSSSPARAGPSPRRIPRPSSSSSPPRRNLRVPSAPLGPRPPPAARPTPPQDDGRISRRAPRHAAAGCERADESCASPGPGPGGGFVPSADLGREGGVPAGRRQGEGRGAPPPRPAQDGGVLLRGGGGGGGRTDRRPGGGGAGGQARIRSGGEGRGPHSGGGGCGGGDVRSSGRGQGPAVVRIEGTGEAELDQVDR